MWGYTLPYTRQHDHLLDRLECRNPAQLGPITVDAHIFTPRKLKRTLFKIGYNGIRSHLANRHQSFLVTLAYHPY